MKKLKFLFLLFLLPLFSSDAFSQAYIFSKNRIVKVASGTFTAANARCSYVNETFVWAEGLDLSAYAGTDLGSTPYLIRLEDASGDVAWGYAGAVGGGEALAAERNPDPGFTQACGAGWNCGSGWTIVAEAATGTASGGILIRVMSLTTNALYEAVYDVSVTGGGVKFYSQGYYGPTRSSSVTWTDYFVPPEGGGSTGLVGASFTGTVDNLSIKQVTDCAATGLHIMSTKNGTTRNWASIGATFGYNDAMKYSIYRIY